MTNKRIEKPPALLQAEGNSNVSTLMYDGIAYKPFDSVPDTFKGCFGCYPKYLHQIQKCNSCADRKSCAKQVIGEV